jgi:hypothetical protein
MKCVILAIILAATSVALAETSKDSKDYPVDVHVRSSRLITVCTGGLCNGELHLMVVIDGKTFELSEFVVPSQLMRVGDYKARILNDLVLSPYRYSRSYEFLFPDGKKSKFVVVGEGDLQ